ncbi:hypothetical protein CDL12_15723 [Handroanthus impetiginosus]|uniref:Uncharacterized protein n=1 Tax=Handroanthus impetiginosus TaxID=429701 RepID=A0A2G9H2E0_9LAMI|nr:hypothetical protein CDL12_15723 [Handroanthus impetiginosus]
MAGCSSSVRISHIKNLQDDDVLLSINATRANTHLLCKGNRHRLVIVDVRNPEADPQSGVSVTSITESSEINYVENDAKVMERDYVAPDTENGADDGGDIGGNGKSSGGGGGDTGDDDYEKRAFGPILKSREEAARTVGLRKAFLLRYLDLQVILCC